MKSLLVAGLLLPVALGAQVDTARLRWVPNPRVANGSWVADPAKHLRPATVARMDSTISALERETSAELAVVVLDSLDGLEPQPAAMLLHRRWGVGKKARDNGIVLLWSPKLRKIYVSVGYGLEGVLPDARVGRIQDDAMIPHFRRNDFDAGMLGGVEALAAAAREETYSGLARNTSLRDSRLSRGELAGSIVGGLGVLFGILFWFVRRPKRCPKGHGAMRRLGEMQDNAFLQQEDVLEEKLGSMNYDVWVCDQCDERITVAHKKIFTSYTRCPQCKRRTVKESSQQLRAPTYSAEGEKEVTRRCKNCSYTKTDRESIAMLVAASSSSSGGGGGGGFSGGGSSFGGGSSGGGGAGRSY